MCIGFSSSVHGSTAYKGPLFTLFGSKSTVHQFDEVFVFAATLLLVTSTLLSEADKLRLSDLYLI